VEAKTSEHHFEGAEPPVTPRLEVLILYEDLGTALRAKRLLDLISEKWDAGAGLNSKLWRRDLLGDSFLREQAAIEAAGADVILLSLHGQRGLPAEVSEWMGRWLHYKEDRSYAVGVLLDPELASKTGGASVVNSVRQLADAASADLFYGYAEVPAAELEAAIGEISRRARSASVVLDETANRAAPRSPPDRDRGGSR
jgi:hypothetical protein